MTSPSPHAAGLPGLLRVLVVFHEGESLGAGTSVLRALPDVQAYGWTTSGWFPDEGELVGAAEERLAAVALHPRPIAFSRAGWQRPPGIARRLARTPTYGRAFREALRRFRPHLVHANTLLALPEALLARSYGLPVVVQVHEMPPDGGKGALAVRLAARTADLLVGVSEAVSTQLRRRARGTPVVTVYNGIDWTTRGPAERAGFTVGTVGTVSRVKGTDVFLRAALAAVAERPDIRFEHVGAQDLHHDAGLNEELEEILAEPAWGGRVRMLGRRPAATALPNWDVFVLSSRSEGFPLATLEAMAHGLPVIATTVGGIPEQIDHLRTGILVRPGDHEALASWIVRLRDDEALRRRLSADGATFVRSKFTIAHQADGIHRAYLTALNRRYGPPAVRRLASGPA